MKCQDCAWFTIQRGRQPYRCSDTEHPAASTCDQFEPLVSETPEVPPREAVGELANEHYRDVFHTIVAESFVVEQDARLTIDTIRAQLQAQGAEVVVESAYFERVVQRLTNLTLLYRLCLATGLGRFADQIVGAEITSMFTRKPDGPRPTKPPAVR